MQCRAFLQSNGNLNLPTSIEVGDAPAVSVRFALDDLDVAVRATLSRWRTRRWLMFPAEARALCAPPRELDVEVAPLGEPVATNARAVVPCNGLVRFRAKVRQHDGLIISIPLAWFRGMQQAGWPSEVRTRIIRSGAEFQFVRAPSVRANGKTVVLALPHRECAALTKGDEVVVELRRGGQSAPIDPAQFPIADWETWTEDRRAAELDRLIETYRTLGFPWGAIRSRIERDPLGAVARSKVVVTADVVQSVGHAGQRTCLAAHPHRLRASYRNALSVVAAFEDDTMLRRALRFQLEHHDPVTPHRLIRALSALVHGPLNFPPALARWLVDTYAPENGIVLDPCSGYGGRLLGALASSKNVTYLGADIEPESVTANRELARLLGASNRVQQEQRAVEDNVAWPKADLVLVGPPYYDRENYGEVSRRALAAYPTYGAWVEGFLNLLVVRSLSAAPRTIFNVAVIHDGRTTYDLPADLVRKVENNGGRVERVLTWKTARFNVARAEKLIVVTR